MMVARTISAPNLGGYSLFASGVEGSPASFEPGIAVDHARQFCQWVADVIVEHGGMMTWVVGVALSLSVLCRLF